MVGNRSAFALAGPAHHTIPTDRRAGNSPRDLLSPARALTAALALAAACWAITVWQMDGMNMGPATALGSFGSFAALWMPMMTAMMLPGATPAVLRHVRAVGRLGAAPLFVVSYLAVWALLGGAVYVVYRPHGTIAPARSWSPLGCTNSRRSRAAAAPDAARTSARDSISASHAPAPASA